MPRRAALIAAGAVPKLVGAVSYAPQLPLPPQARGGWGGEGGQQVCVACTQQFNVQGTLGHLAWLTHVSHRDTHGDTRGSHSLVWLSDFGHTEAARSSLPLPTLRCLPPPQPP